ncbi:SDR family NAD(P)-dependent oxidoreductase [Prauserella muralis]|uniref:3-hydroxy-2-methylbutyryl-CoA dehydrogenase n=1 Tax=Prauserella muralis TaxID=588067 RepID=A0A2V4AE06_9PSEU|nr:SDR family NAD(P)-dependent oxidoreductase [Prauserella muralis]PXY17435.1 3-hydroxy-2-methylbutyryl-CoA dehydrogenase [Prauserella muralis]TWE23607.1 NAD(P)-dependent dehydrogenase (short-subunit alcohol dehydrogenase family) [Prauserella muralis]
MDLKDRVAVVTGAASGLGLATTRALAGRGARVAVLDRDSDAARRLAAENRDNLLPVPVDVADEESVTAAMTTIEENLGAVHLCVNAAGVATPGKVLHHGQPLPLADFRAVVTTNLLGAFDVMRHCTALMARNDPGEDGERGIVINISSGAAWQGQKGQAAYAASKAGLIGLMLPAARDLADHGIRVVTIAPGLFDTGITAGMPDKVRSGLTSMVLNPPRMGHPDELAALVSHIAENRYLNAATLSIDAGARMV